MKIDFHTHILPEIDDGPMSLSLSLKMIQSLQNQRIDAVVLTPHYYSNRRPISEFVEQRAASYKALYESLPSNAPSLHLGAEVYYSEYLFNNRDLTPLCIEGTRTMLLEIPYNQTIDRRFLDKIDRLIGEYGITPVIAHVERYPTLIKSPQTMETLLNFGCVLQVNLSSFHSFGKHRLLRLVNNGYIGALGTDAHNITTRPAEYNKGYEQLQKKISKEVLSDIQSLMSKLLHTR